MFLAVRLFSRVAGLSTVKQGMALLTAAGYPIVRPSLGDFDGLAIRTFGSYRSMAAHGRASRPNGSSAVERAARDVRTGFDVRDRFNWWGVGRDQASARLQALNAAPWLLYGELKLSPRFVGRPGFEAREVRRFAATLLELQFPDALVFESCGDHDITVVLGSDDVERMAASFGRLRGATAHEFSHYSAASGSCAPRSHLFLDSYSTLALGADAENRLSPETRAAMLFGVFPGHDSFVRVLGRREGAGGDWEQERLGPRMGRYDVTVRELSGSDAIGALRRRHDLEHSWFHEDQNEPPIRASRTNLHFASQSLYGLSLEEHFADATELSLGRAAPGSLPRHEPLRAEVSPDEFDACYDSIASRLGNAYTPDDAMDHLHDVLASQWQAMRDHSVARNLVDSVPFVRALFDMLARGAVDGGRQVRIPADAVSRVLVTLEHCQQSRMTGSHVRVGTMATMEHESPSARVILALTGVATRVLEIARGDVNCPTVPPAVLVTLDGRGTTVCECHVGDLLVIKLDTRSCRDPWFAFVKVLHEVSHHANLATQSVVPAVRSLIWNRFEELVMAIAEILAVRIGRDSRTLVGKCCDALNELERAAGQIEGPSADVMMAKLVEWQMEQFQCLRDDERAAIVHVFRDASDVMSHVLADIQAEAVTRDNLVLALVGAERELSRGTLPNDSVREIRRTLSYAVLLDAEPDLTPGRLGNLARSLRADVRHGLLRVAYAPLRSAEFDELRRRPSRDLAIPGTIEHDGLRIWAERFLSRVADLQPEAT